MRHRDGKNPTEIMYAAFKFRVKPGRMKNDPMGIGRNSALEYLVKFERASGNFTKQQQQ